MKSWGREGGRKGGGDIFTWLTGRTCPKQHNGILSYFFLLTCSLHEFSHDSYLCGMLYVPCMHLAHNTVCTRVYNTKLNHVHYKMVV